MNLLPNDITRVSRFLTSCWARLFQSAAFQASPTEKYLIVFYDQILSNVCFADLTIRLDFNEIYELYYLWISFVNRSRNLVQRYRFLRNSSFLERDAITYKILWLKTFEKIFNFARLLTETPSLKRNRSRYYAAGSEFSNFCPQLVYAHRNIDSPRFVIPLLNWSMRYTIAIREQRFHFRQQSVVMHGIRSKRFDFCQKRRKNDVGGFDWKLDEYRESSNLRII